MKNPWLEIQAEDYEGHMGSKSVCQFEPLRKIFNSALKKFSPKKVAILGCATGNGIEEIDFEKIEKLYALDINPNYLEIVKNRYRNNLQKIEAICGDLDKISLSFSEMDFIYAALIFEYVDIGKVLKKAAKSLREGGALIAVIQLPCKEIPEVTPTKFKSLEKLTTIMKLVDIENFVSIAKENKLSLNFSKIHPLKSGKKFWEGRFIKS
jgi:SAM-dependent methyltransferase